MMQRFLENGWQIGCVRRIESLALQVAEMSVAGVRLRVVGYIAAMTTSEARGFIRARAGQEIRRQTRIVLARQTKMNSDWETRVVRLAVEKVIPLVLRPRHDRSTIPPSASMAA